MHFAVICRFKSGRNPFSFLPSFFDLPFNSFLMKGYNRREFLKSGLLASTAFFFSFTPIEKLIASNTKTTATGANDDQTDTRRLQQKAKDFFYHKEYVKAEQTYRQLIFLLPAYIAAYDGLAKTLYAQNKSLAAAEAYRQGWLEQKENPLFCDRLARAMKRLVAGNQKQEKEFCFRIGQTELLEVAAQLYIDAIDSAKAKPKGYLALGLLDVQHTLTKCNKSLKFRGSSTQSFSSSVQDKITLSTQTHRDKWETTRKKRKKKEYNVKTEPEALIRETNCQKKYRRTLQFDTEKASRIKEQNRGNKRLYYSLFAEAIKSKSTLKAEKLQQKILSYDTKDTNVKGRLVHHYRKQKEYDKLVQFQKEQYTSAPNFWKTVSYAQALRLQAKKESRPDLCSTAMDLYKGLASKSKLQSREYLCVYGGHLDCLLQQKQYTEVRSTTLKALAPFPLSLLPFVLVYIKSWVGEGKLDLAEDAYKTLIAGTESTLINNDPIYKHLKTSHKLLVQPTGQAKEVSGFGVKKEVLFDIYYGMADLYKKKSDNAAEHDILNRIKRIEPTNGFVKKRMA